MVEPTYTSRGVSESSVKTAKASSMAEGIIGIGAVALAILGLINILPQLMAAIATIAVGVALAFEGGSISARYAALLTEDQSKKEKSTLWSGVTSLFLAGVAGIAMGILALIGTIPNILIPISAIVFGTALILDSGANGRLSQLEARYSESFKASESVLKETARSSAGLQVLVGIAAIALGILALVGFSWLVLSLAAMLSIGVMNLITGTMISSRMATIFR